MSSGRTGSTSIFGLIASFLKFLGRPLFFLTLYIIYYILYTFILVGKLAIWVATRSTFFFSLTLTLTKLLNRNIVRLAKTATQVSRITFVLLVTCLVFLVIYNFYFLILYDLPSPNQLITRQPILTTKIYDRNGKLLYKIYRNQNRTLVKLIDIPLSMQQATIAIEDKEFYHHQGFSLKGITRSLYRNLLYGTQTGGSTITQQLIKNALLTSEKTWQRKVKEIILAILAEAKFSKQEILQMYLNEVPYGSVAYGVEEAAQTYFDKSIKDINLAEAALLAGLPAAPTKYSPFGANPLLAKARQEQVLSQMLEQGYISQAEWEEAKKIQLVFAKQKDQIRAPHFVMFVQDWLVKKYGEQVVENGGLEVITSLDLDLQEMAQKTVTTRIEKLQPLRISNGAALVTNPKTGEILSMVGSKDYFNYQAEGNYNVTTALRQPGSAIKPVNYAVALQNGFTTATTIPDTPVTYQIPNQPPYSPRNYDGRFHGNISLRVALASSYNVPAVKILAALGIERMVEQGRKMGITTWNDLARYGLSLTLGGGEVKMVDLAVVYGALANLGTRQELNPILKVTNYKGEILEELPSSSLSLLSSQSSQVLPPNIAYLLSNILSDNSARTPAFGPNSLLNVPGHQVAVKTGTTQNLRDNWAIGYTPSFLVAAWVGNNDNTPMSYVASGVTGATPIWHQIMSHLLQDKPNEEFPKPEGVKEVTICGFTNTLSCAACPNPRPEFFVSGSEPKHACNQEMINRLIEQLVNPPVPTPQIGP